MKVGTIGTGVIVDMAIDSMKSVPGIEVDAAYSRTMDKANAFKEKHSMKRAYDSLDNLFADPEIDTIYVASPNALHYAQAKAALEAGKNVILEKPFTPTEAEAKDLFETAEKNGVMIFEAIAPIHTPNFGILQEQLGAAGEIHNAILNYSQLSSRYARYKEGDIANAFDPKMYGGALMDINVYNIHLAASLFGDPDAVHYYPNIGDNGIDTSGTLIMEYPDLTVVCTGAKDSQSPDFSVIEGDEGTFVLDGGPNGRIPSVRFVTAPRHKRVASQTFKDGENAMIFEFMDFNMALNEKNKEAYENWKDETLSVVRILEEASKQRDAKAKASGKLD